MRSSRPSEAVVWLDRVLGTAAAILLFCLMMLTFADVVGRYIFNWPIRGAFEITELLLLVLIFAGLPLVSHADEHVTLDFIDRMLGRSGRVLLRALRAISSAALMFFAGLAGVDQGRQDRRLRRHHRRAAHPGRAVRLFHGDDDGGHRHRAPVQGDLPDAAARRGIRPRQVDHHMTEALIGLALMMVLAFLRMPIAFAMGMVGIVGIRLHARLELGGRVRHGRRPRSTRPGATTRCRWCRCSS